MSIITNSVYYFYEFCISLTKIYNIFMKDMNARLMDIVEDENLSWNKLLVNSKDKFFVRLKEDTVCSILENRSMLSSQDIENFKFLKHEILQIKKILQEGCGFFIIDGKIFSEFSKKELEYIYSIISQMLGKLYVQNIQNENCDYHIVVFNSSPFGDLKAELMRSKVCLHFIPEKEDTILKRFRILFKILRKILIN